MNISHKEIIIRKATPDDANILCKWWNDGAVMAHAGFPNGLSITESDILQSIAKYTDDTRRLHIIEIDGLAVGEMSYRNIGESTAEIGIKICDDRYQNKGYGKKALTLYLDALFNQMNFQKIILDTNVKNKRAQHLYAKLGFKVVEGVSTSWRDQLGDEQQSIHFKINKAQYHVNQRLRESEKSTLYTKRIALKPINKEVAQSIFENFSEDVTTYMFQSPAKAINETLDFIHSMQRKRNMLADFVYSIHSIKTGEFIGCVGLHHLNADIPELGIWIKSSLHGNGYGREAVGELIDFAKTAGYLKLKYPVDRRNVPSRKIPQSFGGVVVEADLRVTTPDGRVLEEVVYHIDLT